MMIGISTVGTVPRAFIVFAVAEPTIIAPVNASACSEVALSDSDISIS